MGASREAVRGRQPVREVEQLIQTFRRMAGEEPVIAALAAFYMLGRTGGAEPAVDPRLTLDSIAYCLIGGATLAGGSGSRESGEHLRHGRWRDSRDLHLDA